MKPAIGYVEDPACRSGMRNSQRSRTANILIINQRPSIETISTLPDVGGSTEKEPI
jgi:hypothetical protein